MSRPLAVINDTHIGVIRSAGTTLQTALALRQYALERFKTLLEEATDSDLLINGDLFDTEAVPYDDLLATYRMLAEWLITNSESHLYLPPGNHDLSKTATRMSSQQFLTALLVALLPSRVHAPTQGFAFFIGNEKGWIIPHMPNQDRFDIELGKVPKDTSYLFVHCNFDNKFAVQSDHSLNMSKEQAQACPAKKIVFGHEHQFKMALSGKVMISGNQFPTSVADCLGNKDKKMTIIDEASLTMKPVWTADGVNGTSFQRVNWRELGSADASAQFIRVEGDATASEAPAVVTAISKFRKGHGAFVITNAVSIEGRVVDETAESMANVANFNVVMALFELLAKKPGWAAKVKAIMEKNNVSAA